MRLMYSSVDQPRSIVRFSHTAMDVIAQPAVVGGDASSIWRIKNSEFLTLTGCFAKNSEFSFNLEGYLLTYHAATYPSRPLASLTLSHWLRTPIF